MPETIHEIDPARVRPFVSRDRDQAKEALAIEDTKRHGQIQPGKVRDIRHLPKEERARPEGGEYWYQLVYGQGRLERAKKLKVKFRAVISTESEIESIGGFLTENMNRVALPWAVKARLVSAELKSGKENDEIAKKLRLSEGHVRKMRHIIEHRSPKVAAEVEKMTMNDAEVLVTAPKDHQPIIMEVFHETKQSDIKAVVKLARTVAEKHGGELSERDLKKSLDRVDDDLQEIRDALKLARLHWSVGPGNLAKLLEIPKFRAALQKEGVHFAKFEAVSES